MTKHPLGGIMKSLLIGLMTLTALTTQAANFGKFKLTVETGYYDGEEVVFLMNSSGDLKMLENSDYYSIDTQFFFGENTLDIRSGGDDDIVIGTIYMKDNKAIDGCAAMLSLSNEAGETLGTNSFKLERWNKFSKRYESVYKSGFEFTKSCEDKLLADYADFSIF